jgi:hypothetical protein
MDDLLTQAQLNHKAADDISTALAYLHEALHLLPEHEQLTEAESLVHKARAAIRADALRLEDEAKLRARMAT